jgi:putative ATPase
LTEEEVTLIVGRALTDKRGLEDHKVDVDPEALKFVVSIANGDARVALNLLELSVLTTPEVNGARRVALETAQDVAQRKAILYDKAGEEHYNLISAFHKSLRGSDADASLYWLARMLEAGEDPLYVARRMVRFASEDIGNADPQALQIAVAAKEAVHFIGLPEGNLALAQAAIYLATAPKSNSTYRAYAKAKEDVEKTQNEPVPLHIRNPVTPLMKELGYGKGYRYPHDFPAGIVKQGFLPGNLEGKTYYHPTDRGFEKEIKRRLEHWKKLKEELEND